VMADHLLVVTVDQVIAWHCFHSSPVVAGTFACALGKTA
jgi:hypothetical protein